MKKRVSTAAAAIVAALSAMLVLTSCLHIERIDPVPAETDPPIPAAPETDPPEPDAPEPAFIPVNFTLENLWEENLISNILRWNDSVTVYRDYDGGSQTESLWLRDGDRVYYTLSVYDDGEQAYSSEAGNYRGCDFYVMDEGEPVAASRWVTAEAESFDGWIETLIADFLPSELTEDILILSEDDNTYTILLKENLETDVGTVPCENTAVINKGTLAVYAYSWEYMLEGTRHYGSFTVEYNGEKLGEDVLAAWDNTARISLDVLTEAGGERTETFARPVDWQFRLVPDEGILLVSPDAMEEDGSLLFTPGGGDASVFVRDEANAVAPDSPDGSPDSAGNPGAAADPSSGELPFTLETLMETNRITNLLNRYGTLTMENETEFGYSRVYYFRFGQEGSIVRFTESGYGGDEGAEYRDVSGNLYGDSFEAGEDGGYIYYASVPDTGDYLFVDTNEEGEHYDYDLTLTEALMMGSVTDVRTEGENVVFRYAYDFDDTGESDMIYTVDAESAEIRAVGMGSGTAAVIRYGGEVPFEKELTEAFRKSRTILCHFEGVGDFTYVLPADWAFNAGWFEDLPCFADAAMKEEVSSRIPGDGQDYEIWIRTAAG